jgi:hypothetical protein
MPTFAWKDGDLPRKISGSRSPGLDLKSGLAKNKAAVVPIRQPRSVRSPDNATGYDKKYQDCDIHNAKHNTAAHVMLKCI